MYVINWFRRWYRSRTALTQFICGGKVMWPWSDPNTKHTLRVWAKLTRCAHVVGFRCVNLSQQTGGKLVPVRSWLAHIACCIGPVNHVKDLPMLTLLLLPKTHLTNDWGECSYEVCTAGRLVWCKETELRGKCKFTNTSTDWVLGVKTPWKATCYNLPLSEFWTWLCPTYYELSDKLL